ncbi:hypothetical protein D3C71_1704840 [compost metagenome]
MPLRVPIGKPSTAVNPMVLATLRPYTSAHMLLPFPRCAMMARPDAAFGSNCASTPAMYS